MTWRLQPMELKGFSQKWWVYPRYEIQDDLVVPMDLKHAAIEARAHPEVRKRFRSSGLGARRVSGGEGTREYDPMDRPELPGEFAKLACGDPDQILAFVHEYGQLGYYFAAESLESSSEERRNLRKSKYAQGDPLSWVVEHAKAVQLVLNLREAFNDRSRLRQQLEPLIKISTDDSPSMLSFSFVARLAPDTCQLHLFSENSKENAIRIFSEILNPNLTGTRRVIEGPIGRIRSQGISRQIRSKA